MVRSSTQPKILDVEKSLGFRHTDKHSGISRQPGGSAGPVITRLLGEIDGINSRFRHLRPSAIRSSPELEKDIDRVFHLLGPDIWPGPGTVNEAPWLVDADSSPDERYPKNLFYSQAEDREILLVHFRTWLREKACQHSANRRRSQSRKDREQLSDQDLDLDFADTGSEYGNQHKPQNSKRSGDPNSRMPKKARSSAGPSKTRVHVPPSARRRGGPTKPTNEDDSSPQVSHDESQPAPGQTIADSGHVADIKRIIAEIRRAPDDATAAASDRDRLSQELNVGGTSTENPEPVTQPGYNSSRASTVSQPGDVETADGIIDHTARFSEESSATEIFYDATRLSGADTEPVRIAQQALAITPPTADSRLADVNVPPTPASERERDNARGAHEGNEDRSASGMTNALNNLRTTPSSKRRGDETDPDQVQRTIVAAGTANKAGPSSGRAFDFAPVQGEPDSKARNTSISEILGIYTYAPPALQFVKEAGGNLPEKILISMRDIFDEHVGLRSNVAAFKAAFLAKWGIDVQSETHTVPLAMNKVNPTPTSNNNKTITRSSYAVPAATYPSTATRTVAMLPQDTAEAVVYKGLQLSPDQTAPLPKELALEYCKRLSKKTPEEKDQLRRDGKCVRCLRLGHGPQQWEKCLLGLFQSSMLAARSFTGASTTAPPAMNPHLIESHTAGVEGHNAGPSTPIGPAWPLSAPEPSAVSPQAGQNNLDGSTARHELPSPHAGVLGNASSPARKRAASTMSVPEDVPSKKTRFEEELKAREARIAEKKARNAVSKEAVDNERKLRADGDDKREKAERAYLRRMEREEQELDEEHEALVKERDKEEKLAKEAEEEAKALRNGLLRPSKR